MLKSIIVGYLFIFATSLYALVPVEGILLGEAVDEYQQDPLYYIFSDIYDKSVTNENAKLKLYQNTFNSGVNLQESCALYSAPVYSTPWMEKQAKRSIAATLQYIGIDTSIKTIAAYAKKMDMNEDSFKTLSTNLVKNYCSKNITIFSIKRLEQSFGYYYKEPPLHLIPTIASSPFATEAYKGKTDTTQSRSNEFDQAINNFKAFCSWGGDVVDYRMMTPYLKNPFIMSFVYKNLIGIQDKYDPIQGVKQVSAPKETIQVNCEDLICRSVSVVKFKEKFPTSVGSTGIYTDLAKLYCHHFKFQDYSSANAIPEVKGWIKKMELEDPIFETSFFISVMTGVPDVIFGVDSYRDLPGIAKSSIDERWNKWANQALNTFSKDMLFEESLKVKAQPRRELSDLRMSGFGLDFFVTLGEMDRVVDESDKLALNFDLKISKNYLRHVKTKWIQLTNEIDEEGRLKFRDEVSRYINLQLDQKKKYFRQQMWNDEFSRLITQELVGQLLAYRGPMFDSYQDEMLRVPIKFSYGVFALSYLRYRSDVKAGRLKLNL